MQFDVRQAKNLKVGDYLTVADAPGLRLVCSTAGRAWIYRYKSPLTGLMKQVKFGSWPGLSAPQAWLAWEQLRTQREAGRDPAVERILARKALRAKPTDPATGNGQHPRTVGHLVKEFVEQAARRRKPKGAAELRRTMATMLAPVADLTPEQVTRSVAYNLVDRYRTTPVQAASLRRELGAAWEWAHDSGRLADDVPNWWRQVLRGKLHSAGKIIGGRHQGVSKRVLSLDEVGAVLRHLPHISRLISDLLTLYLWTGCRGAEIVAIEGAEISEMHVVRLAYCGGLSLARRTSASSHSVPLRRTFSATSGYVLVLIRSPRTRSGDSAGRPRRFCSGACITQRPTRRASSA